MMKDTKQLLAKPVTRRDFLQLVRVAILSAFNVAALISIMKSQVERSTLSPEAVKKETGSGFGSSKFGD